MKYSGKHSILNRRINCRQINRQQKEKKKSFIICKQLNGPVLKSLIINLSGPGRNWKKKKKVGPGPRLNFAFCLGPGRARADISVSLSCRDGPGPEKSGTCRALAGTHKLIFMHCFISLHSSDAQKNISCKK